MMKKDQLEEKQEEETEELKEDKQQIRSFELVICNYGISKYSTLCRKARCIHISE